MILSNVDTSATYQFSLIGLDIGVSQNAIIIIANNTKAIFHLFLKINPTMSALRAGLNMNIALKRLKPGGKKKAAIVPIKAAKVPKYGPRTIPNTDAIDASNSIFISGKPITGIPGNKDKTTYNAAKRAIRETIIEGLLIFFCIIFIFPSSYLMSIIDVLRDCIEINV
jgi:hypothetical protein